MASSAQGEVCSLEMTRMIETYRCRSVKATPNVLDEELIKEEENSRMDRRDDGLAGLATLVRVNSGPELIKRVKFSSILSLRTISIGIPSHCHHACLFLHES